MARFSSVLLALFIASASVAVPVQQRQLGNIQCNLDRVKILARQTARDAATGTAVTAARAGLNKVNGAIENIALALVTGKAARADARTAVSEGLNETRSALAGIINPSVNATVAAAQAKVQDTIDTGNDVLADCN